MEGGGVQEGQKREEEGRMGGGGMNKSEEVGME